MLFIRYFIHFPFTYMKKVNINYILHYNVIQCETVTNCSLKIIFINSSENVNRNKNVFTNVGFISIDCRDIVLEGILFLSDVFFVLGFFLADFVPSCYRKKQSTTVSSKQLFNS